MIISKLIIFLIMTYEYLGSKREARALQKEWKRVMDEGTCYDSRYIISQYSE